MSTREIGQNLPNSIEQRLIEQQLRQNEHWFKLRLVGAYAFLILLTCIIGVCIHVIVSDRYYTDKIINAATIVLLTGLGSLFVTVRKVIVNTIALEQPILQKAAPSKKRRSPEPEADPEPEPSRVTDLAGESVMLQRELSD